jgi:hypothetical protein
VLLVLSGIPAAAQTHIRFFSSFARGGVIPKDCAEAITLITPMITSDSPEGWTWIVACDEIAWKRVEDHLGQLGVQGRILATSDLEYHITYVRAEDVLHPVAPGLAYSAEHTIAHELGHILMHTADEDKAEKKARELLSGQMVATGR